MGKKLFVAITSSQFARVKAKKTMTAFSGISFLDLRVEESTMKDR
jgi:hypothetical protein